MLMSHVLIAHIACLLCYLLVVVELRLQLLQSTAQAGHEGVVSLDLLLETLDLSLELHDLPHELGYQLVPAEDREMWESRHCHKSDVKANQTLYHRMSAHLSSLLGAGAGAGVKSNG